RYEVYSEQYILAIEVEAKLVIDMATTGVYPAATSYLTELTSSIASASSAGISLDKSVATSIASDADAMMKSVAALSVAIESDDFSSVEDHMQYCAGTLCGLMGDVRKYADSLEAQVADSAWPFPKYSEMLFIK
ncbi:MAG: hypothetical protein KUG73_08240, partial [Pseudomonadales bacterium]|nr:hypothetical protein [Pseudomonadales bacterium]